MIMRPPLLLVVTCLTCCLLTASPVTGLSQPHLESTSHSMPQAPPPQARQARPAPGPQRPVMSRRDALLRGCLGSAPAALLFRGAGGAGGMVVGVAAGGGFAAPASARSGNGDAGLGQVRRWFEGEYDDQLHPLCERRVSVRSVDINPDNKKAGTRFVATFEGTDLGPAGIGDKVFLPCDEKTKSLYASRTFSFEAVISPDGESVDAGDGIHVGRYKSERKGDDFDGIRWQDGNRWIRQRKETEGLE